MRSYDSWKTTNPTDEYLGPDPNNEPDPDELRERQRDDANRRSQTNTFNSRRPRGIGRASLRSPSSSTRKE